MTIELYVLGWAVLLAALQLVLYAAPANRALGVDYTMGPRDEQKPLPAEVARLKRAFDNHIEGLVLHAAATLLVVLGDAVSILTHLCALAYLAARILYVPAYAYGWTPWRSVIWGVGFLATLLMTLAGLFL